MSAELAARIENVRFTLVRVGEGYAMADVDTAMEFLRASVLRGEPLAPLLARLSLSTVRMRESYDIAEVDAFLIALRDGTPLPEPPPKEPGDFSRLFGRG